MIPAKRLFNSTNVQAVYLTFLHDILLWEWDLRNARPVTVAGEVVKQQPLLTFMKIYQQVAIRFYGVVLPSYVVITTDVRVLKTAHLDELLAANGNLSWDGAKNLRPCFGLLMWTCQSDHFPGTFSPDSPTPVNQSYLHLCPPNNIVLAASCFFKG